VRSGELARLSGVSTDTLRHYERLGILQEPHRTNGGYRNYPADSLQRVRLIQSALSVGFSLSELATVLGMRDRGQPPCQQVRAMAGQKLSEVERQIKDLLLMRDYLHRILKTWDRRLKRMRDGQPAGLLESLPAGLFVKRLRRVIGKG
jgi:DNA-binding transcriptional MerR regulator